MEARLNPSLAPHFWELDPIKAFQPLCVDLLAQEPGIASADEYGINGQGQLGIDILGKDINGETTVVGQCKCYKDFKAIQVTKAADEFYEHYEYWQQKGVNHFILLVACDLSDRKIQDEISNQRKRFIQIGIHFEAWSGSILRNKLMPYPAIAQRHIQSQEVLRNICGPTVQGLVFTPNASIEKTLQELREAMREPDRYYADIEELLINEARKVLEVVQNSSFTLSSFEPAACTQYLQPLINVSERLVRLSAALIKWDNRQNFTNILIKVFKLLAQDPLKPESRRYSSGVPEINLYPLALMIYTIYIVGVEYKSTNLLQTITQVRFRSQRSELQNQNLPGILRCIYYNSKTENFFKIVESNHHIRPIAKTIKNLLLNWLEKDLTFLEESYYCGEFVLGLTILESHKDFIFPALYLYLSESKDFLENFIANKRWLKELFPDIEYRLQCFDELSIQAAKKTPLQRAYGFHGNALNLYQNS